MKKTLKFILVGILLFDITISFMFGGDIHISDQMNTFGLLKDIAITIFTIMGIWLAILQSDKLKKIFNIGETVVLNHSEQVWLKNLLIPILISSLILIMLIAISLVNIILKSLILTTYAIIILRSVFLFILIILSLLNIYAIIISMKPIIVIFLNITGSKNKLDNIRSNIPSKNIIKNNQYEHD